MHKKWGRGRLGRVHDGICFLGDYWRDVTGRDISPHFFDLFQILTDVKSRNSLLCL